MNEKRLEGSIPIPAKDGLNFPDTPDAWAGFAAGVTEAASWAALTEKQVAATNSDACLKEG